jgi:hypothetical protein
VSIFNDRELVYSRRSAEARTNEPLALTPSSRVAEQGVFHAGHAWSRNA